MKKSIILGIASIAVVGVVVGAVIVHAFVGQRYVNSMQDATHSYTLNELPDSQNPTVHCYVLTGSNANPSLSCVYVPSSNSQITNPSQVVQVAPTPAGLPSWMR